MAKKKKLQTRAAPQVGIIFFFDHKLWIESTPLETAGNWGKFKIHEGDHVLYWERLILEGLVPRGSEYENVPRGRGCLLLKSKARRPQVPTRRLPFVMLKTL
jgi:hypothetical protein